MIYRKLKAEGLFTGDRMLDGNSVLICSENGQVEAIVPEHSAGENVEQFHGILSPGFINCHCHLELSHLKGLIREKTGLVDFVFTVVTQRHFPEEEILDAIAGGEDEMLQNGIVAVGDICNNALTISSKEQQRLHYYNFVEVSGWSPAVAHARFQRSKGYYEDFLRLSDTGSQVSMAPHASYSVSPELWGMMKDFYAGKTTTIHNQETAWEDELFMKGTGEATRMYGMMKIDNNFFNPSGKSSLQTCLHHLEPAKKLLLVHNTFINETDLIYCHQSSWMGALFFCLCPNANQYIENRLPPVDLLRRQHATIVFGTDSLASNHTLNILEEIKTIAKNFPAVPSEEMLRWATHNGARALQLDHLLGSFEKGKRPGVVLIENTDGNKITDQSRVRRII
jgi:cytosine/adenosine deaminase-related metal-dependent hydrolase